MSNFVKYIKAKGIYGRFDIEHSFKPGVNILHGKNGAGKTTLLHILANVLNGDYELFAYLTFDSIQVQLDDSTEVMLHRIGTKKDATIHIEQTGYSKIEVPVELIKEYAVRRREPHRVQQLGLFDDQLELLKRLEPLMRTAYFPAFRTMIEAWIPIQEDRPTSAASAARRGRELMEAEDYRIERSILLVRRATMQATQSARELFGQFVPSITYPSPLEIEVRLTDEFRKAERNIGYANQELLSQAFLDIFSVLSEASNQVGENPEAILEQIRSLFNKLDTSSFGTAQMADKDFYTKLRNKVEDFKFYESKNLEGVAVRILELYRNSLNKRADIQESSFLGIRQYLQAVNDFLEGKSLYIQQLSSELHRPALQVKFDDGSYSALRALSSGERQIITMIYAASQMSAQKIVLIDEPEISLHIDWQRLLLKKMSEQLQDRQIIVCTHSPVIGANYEDRLMELKLVPTSRQSQKDLSDYDNPETEGEDEVLF